MIYYIRSNEELVGLKYNDEIYYYIKNNQDDIIGIMDSNYNIVVKYVYDSWGNIISIKDNNGNEVSDNHIGKINPYRYRSYYYDNETKLYYLNSRYYNPLWGRFINADNYVSTDTGLLGHNMYAYCNNNSINYDDPTGHFIGIGMLGVIVGIGAGILVNSIYRNNKSKKEIKQVQKNKNVPDRTTKLNMAVQQNANNIKQATIGKNYVEKLNIFVQSVKKGSTYDLKDKREWQETILYNGIVMEAQDIGNFNFGYIGRAMGYDINFLNFGAGGAQVLDNWDKSVTYLNCFSISMCDDPRDAYYIRMGAIKYDQEN